MPDHRTLSYLKTCFLESNCMPLTAIDVATLGLGLGPRPCDSSLDCPKFSRPLGPTPLALHKPGVVYTLESWHWRGRGKRIMIWVILGY